MKNFDSNLFNKIYEENRINNVFDDGYGDWMKKIKLTNNKKCLMVNLIKICLIVNLQNIKKNKI